MTAEKLISQVNDLPAPSTAVVQLVSIINAPEPDTAQIVEVVRKDAVLTTRLLALCNSAAMGLADRVGSVDQAVLWLGENEIYRLAVSLGLGKTLSADLPGYAMSGSDFQRHALLTAAVAEQLFPHASRDDDEEDDGGVTAPIAYTCGLLHDIGKTILGVTLDAEAQEKLATLVRQQEHTLIEAERSALGTDHAEVGGCLLGLWRFPEIFANAVSRHHAPNTLLASIVHVANLLAHEVDSPSGDAAFAERVAGSALEDFNLDAEKYELLVSAATQAQEKVDRILSAA